MMNLLRRSGGKAATPVPPDDAPQPRTGRPVFAVGDLHGRADLLGLILSAIHDRIRDDALSDFAIIFMGDYIDRGPRSEIVLDVLADLQRNLPDTVTCLKGNHEAMLLDFLDGSPGGETWREHGADATLTALGLDPRDRPRRLRRALAERLGAARITWLRDMPAVLRIGDVIFAHADLDPHATWDAQSETTLLWGNPRRWDLPLGGGLWAVHGHRPVPRAKASDHRLMIDTGAYDTGRLSGVFLPGKGAEFFDVSLPAGAPIP